MAYISEQEAFTEHLFAESLQGQLYLSNVEQLKDSFYWFILAEELKEEQIFEVMELEQFLMLLPKGKVKLSNGTSHVFGLSFSISGVSQGDSILFRNPSAMSPKASALHTDRTFHGHQQQASLLAQWKAE